MKLGLTKDLWKVILVALLLRLLIMPFLFHPDLKTHFYHFRFLEQGVTNIYQYISDNKSQLSYKDTYNYPPLPYFFFGSYFAVAEPFLGQEFTTWMNDWGANWFTSPNIFRFLFVLKVPYLLFDLLIGFVLLQLVEKEFQKKVLLLWFFNPITLYIIYGMATFDVVVTFLVLLSLLLYKKEKLFYSGLSLGASIAFKLFPVLFIPIFLIALVSKQFSLKKTMYFLFGTSLIPVLTIFPFLMNVIDTQNSGLMAKFLEFKIPILNQPIFFFNYLLVLLLAVVIFFRNKSEESNWQKINFSISLLLLLMLGFTNYHPQWLIWVLPFLILSSYKYFWSLLVFVPLILSYLMHVISIKDKFILNGILSPIFPFIYDLDSIDQTIFARIAESAFSKITFSFFFIGLLVLIGSKLKVIQKKSYSSKLISGMSGLLIIVFFAALIGLTTYYHSKKTLTVSQTENIQTTALLKSSELTQEFIAPENINSFYILMKNPNYRNSDKANIMIMDQTDAVLSDFSLNGINIGGEDWVKIKIIPLNNIFQQHLHFHLTSETEDPSKALEIPLSSRGELNYKIYSNNSFLMTFQNDLLFFVKNLELDKPFSIFYSLLIFGVTLFCFKLFLYKKS